MLRQTKSKNITKKKVAITPTTQAHVQKFLDEWETPTNQAKTKSIEKGRHQKGAEILLGESHHH